MLDGLDEVPHGLQKAFRQTVAATLAQFRPERVIVTCRIRSYEGEARLPQFEAHTLAPFTEDQIRRFVQGWYDAQQRYGRVNARQARDKAGDLAGAALSGELRELAENPMLLTTMALIHQREIKLPPQRVKLYTLAVDVLVRRWQKGKTGELAAFLNDTLQVRAALERLAFEAHRAGLGQKQMADLPRGTALTILEGPQYIGSTGLAGEFLDYVDQRAGLLVGRGGEPGRPQVYSFPHRTFQEYLAGCHFLSGRDSGAQARAFCERAGEGEYWSLAAKLAAEELCHNVPRGKNQLLDLAYHLCPCNPPVTTQDRRADLWSAHLAALLGDEAIRRDHSARDGGARYLERLAPRLAALLTSDLTAVERAEAGQILGQFGDPRPGVGLKNRLPDIDWIEIPPGPFVMGSKKGETSYDDETPQFNCNLIQQSYFISRYPVTVAQYQVFVDDKGYEQDRFWNWSKAAAKWRESQKEPGAANYQPVFQTPNHPRVGVSWFEAVAFCHWLSEKLKDRSSRREEALTSGTDGASLPRLLPGEEIRLPSEAEWERAARGTKGRAYPWGPETDLAQRCNMADTGIGHTSAVGMFPRGETPPEAANKQGVADLAGNVWEWCRTPWLSDYKDYENKVKDHLEGENARVLRGASWNFGDPVGLVSSFRYLGAPGSRYYVVGFRVVLVGVSVR